MLGTPDEEALMAYFKKHQISRRTVIIGGAVVVVAGATAAYMAFTPGAQPEPEPRSTQPTTPPPSQPIVTPTAPTPSPEPKPPVTEPIEKGKLVIAIQDRMRSLNPVDFPPGGSGGPTVVKSYYENLSMNDRSQAILGGALIKVPLLALEVGPAFNFKTIRVKLRPGVTFHSGDKLTSEAIKTSLLDVYNTSRRYATFSPIQKVELLDELTADVVWTKNSITNWASLTHDTMPSIFNPNHVNGLDDIKELSTEVDGTGPFKVKESIPGVKLVLERNLDYYGDKLPDNEKTLHNKQAGNIHEVTYVTIREPAAQLTALEAGDVDVIANTPASDVSRMLESPNIQVALTGTQSLLMLHINTVYKPLKDKRVRLALAHAIDSAGLSNLFEGFFFVPDALLLPWHLGRDTNIKAVWPLDPGKSKTLLADAGYKDGFDMNLTPNSPPVERVTISSAVAAMFEEIGIDSTVEVMSRGAWRLLTQDQEQTTSHMHPVSAGFGTTIDYFRSSFLNGTRSRTGIDHPVIEDLMRKVSLELDPAKRVPLYREASKYVADEVLMLIPLNLQRAVSARKTVINLEQGLWKGSGGFIPYRVSA